MSIVSRQATTAEPPLSAAPQHGLPNSNPQTSPVVLGHHVIIVTSGAVGAGCQHLHMSPEAPKRRALAAVGQVQLIKFYEDFLGALGMVSALLTELPDIWHIAWPVSMHATHAVLPQYRS